MGHPLTLAALFEKLHDSNLVERSKSYALWTLPQLLAVEHEYAGRTTQQQVMRDFQEIGALLVNNLSSKLASILFPPQRPFFKMDLGEDMRRVAMEQFGVGEADLDSELATIESDASQQVFKNASYNQLIMALKHLIVTGNVLVHRDPESRQIIAYGMNQFGIRRDTRGRMLDCVLRENTYFEALEPDLQTRLRIAEPDRYSDERPEGTEVKLYTRIRRYVTTDGAVRYAVSQAVDNTTLPEVAGDYPEGLCPWIAPTWSLIAGEHYGRGLVEDYAGGFATLSELSHAGLLYDVNMLKVLNLVAAGWNGTDTDSLATKETGEWVQGNPEHVKAYEAGDYQKSVVIEQKVSGIFARLSRAFMYTGNTRDAERVTAFELRQLAMEAETTLGGNYSALAESMQLPLARLLMLEVRPRLLAAITTGILQIDVEAGIPALGRSNELYALLGAVQDGSVAAQLAQLDPRMSRDRLWDVAYAGHSVDAKKYRKSEAEQRADAEAQAAQAEAQVALQGAELAANQAAINQLPQ